MANDLEVAKTAEAIDIITGHNQFNHTILFGFRACVLGCLRIFCSLKKGADCHMIGNGKGQQNGVVTSDTSLSGYQSGQEKQQKVLTFLQTSNTIFFIAISLIYCRCLAFYNKLFFIVSFVVSFSSFKTRCILYLKTTSIEKGLIYRRKTP